MKKMLLAVFAMGLMATGCNKDTTENKLNNNVSDMNDLVVPEGFDWKTSHEVTIELKGLDLPKAVNKTVLFKNAKGDVILKRFVNMGDDYTFAVDYPDHMKTVTMEIGGMTKTSEVHHGSVNFNYSKADDRSDLDPQDR